LLFLLEMGLTLLAIVIAYRIEQFLAPTNIEIYRYAAFTPLIWVPLSYFMNKFGAYRGLRVRSLMSYSWIVVRSLLFSLAVLVLLLVMMNIDYVPRSWFLAFFIVDVVLLVLFRGILIWWYFRRSIEKGENYLKILIIGTGDRARHLTKMLHEHNEWGIDVIGYLDTDVSMIGEEIDGEKVIGTIDDIHKILTSNVVDEVIFAIPRSMIQEVEKIASACEVEGVKFRLMANVFQLNVTRMRLADLGGLPMLTFEPVAQNELMLLVKRLFDIAVTLFFMPLLLPIFILIAIAVRLESPGPAFFIQQRVGLRKRLFPMFKFRSMYQDAEERIKEIEHLNEAEGPIFKIKNDPRVTRVGDFLRKTSLDELPQLINVLLGHMSLVGPRPMSIRDVNLFDQGIQRKRFSVRPGITCIWQISGRSDLPFKEWLKLDLEYIENWTFLLDLKILIKTIPAVLFSKGAV